MRRTLTRFGLLTVVTNFVFWSVLENFPLTTQGSSWYAGISLTGILLMAAITATQLKLSPPSEATAVFLRKHLSFPKF
jgi:hypothetical protein